MPGNPDVNPPVQEMPAIQTTSATFQINNVKLRLLCQNVPVFTLSINDNIKFLENNNRITISWSKCRSEIITQPKNNNLYYLIDPTFRNIDRLFVFHSKMVTMFLQEILLINITCQ